MYSSACICFYLFYLVSLCLCVFSQYGLIGRNGVGKTTLLRHMAAYDIEGFPRHHRVMHVRQEIKPSDKHVLQVLYCMYVFFRVCVFVLYLYPLLLGTCPYR